MPPDVLTAEQAAEERARAEQQAEAEADKSQAAIAEWVTANFIAFNDALCRARVPDMPLTTMEQQLLGVPCHRLCMKVDLSKLDHPIVLGIAMVAASVFVQGRRGAEAARRRAAAAAAEADAETTEQR